MRFADLVRLSLSALWQQKTRALLTTLGVVFGALVLVFSLSLGQGVQSTIDRESQRSSFLRRIDVHPHWEKSEADLPPEELRINGDMSDEKRQRLRGALVEQKLRDYWTGPRAALTPQRLRELRELEHVESVIPIVQERGWAILGQRSQEVATTSADPDNANLRSRLIAGDLFQDAHERSVVISEFLCYLLGVTDDAAVSRLIGSKLRLEFRTAPQPTGLNVWLFKGDGSRATHQEEVAVDKIKHLLPKRLDQFDLSAEEKDALSRALREPPPVEVHQEEFTIRGVVRAPGKDERGALWDPLNRDGDVLLPRGTAETMYFRQQTAATVGVNEAVVLVDREENVRTVQQRIEAMKLRADAPLEYIERERLIYMLIFSTMACVAAVALLVAALGITNTMLMSVLERTREIGVFKAVGAGDGTVQMIFLIEGAFIGLLGGLGGLLLGWAASFPADAWIRSLVSRDLKIELKESLFVFPWWLTSGVVLFAVLVTTLAAFFPALRAARINPVTALRNE